MRPTTKTIDTSKRSSWIVATTWTTTGKDAKRMPVGTVVIRMRDRSGIEREYTYAEIPLWWYGALHMSDSIGRAYGQILKGSGHGIGGQVVFQPTPAEPVPFPGTHGNGTTTKPKSRRPARPASRPTRPAVAAA